MKKNPKATERFTADDFFFDIAEADEHARRGPLGRGLTPEEVRDIEAQVHEAGRRLAEAIEADEDD